MLYARSIRRNIVFGLEAEDGCGPPPGEAEIEEAAKQARHTRTRGRASQTHAHAGVPVRRSRTRAHVATACGRAQHAVGVQVALRASCLR